MAPDGPKLAPHLSIAASPPDVETLEIMDLGMWALGAVGVVSPVMKDGLVLPIYRTIGPSADMACLALHRAQP